VRASFFSAGWPIGIRLSRTMVSGSPSIREIEAHASAKRSSLSRKPSQTAPRPNAVAARSRFSVAAEQSCTKKCSEIVGSPHTAMHKGASKSTLLRASAKASRVLRSVTTTKCHGLRFPAEGAAIAASSSVLTSLSSTGSAVYLRMLRRANIVAISSFVKSYTLIAYCWTKG